MFQKFYRRGCLCWPRGCPSERASDDAEASTISKLQRVCGSEYTSKRHRMFQDTGVSKDLNEQFKKHLTNSEPLDCEYPWVPELH